MKLTSSSADHPSNQIKLPISVPPLDPECKVTLIPLKSITTNSKIIDLEEESDKELELSQSEET